ncbi:MULTISPECIES: exonuclease domain-containing protein [unclassified Moraxella]|uniref:exonuclease domain-containing protein n=1 Tax=unclassified Moraxella TaxID=2685852 RepID=UPI00359E060C
MFDFLNNLLGGQSSQSKDPKYAHLAAHLTGKPPADEWVCLDLELTGLDPKNHHILSISAVKISKAHDTFVIDTANALSIICRPPIMPSTNSIIVHHLRPCDVKNGVSTDEMIACLLPFIGTRPIIGFCTSMDAKFINALIKPRLGKKLPNTLIDVTQLDQKLRQKTNKNSDLPIDKRHLTELLQAYQIPILPAHDSLNDALMTAMLFCHLKSKLG